MSSRFGLTKRELEICGLIAKGLSNDQIAKLLYLTGGTVKNYITSIFEKTGASNRAQVAATFVAEFAQIETDLSDPPVARVSLAYTGPKLRLIGSSELPDVIPLRLAGRPFIIGRFDVSVGRKQCDFEFDKTTKAVSRRHAAIELTASGFAIVDLDSRAGTFVNGNKVMPGQPHLLQHGDVVSFGGMGAEYVFEA